MRTVPIAMAAVLLVSAAPVDALAGAYPEPVRAYLADVLDAAATERGPLGHLPHPDSLEALERARERLAAGELQSAVDHYALFRLEHIVQVLLDENEGLGGQDAWRNTENVTTSALSSARGLVAAHRDLVNRLDPDALSVQGAQTAMWGALLVARGEHQLNLYESFAPAPATARAPGEAELRQRLFQPTFALVGATLGGAIAALGPRVGGETPEAGVLSERLERIARLRLTGSAPPEFFDPLPRGNQTLDGPILRAALLVVSWEALRALEVSRIYQNAAGRQDVLTTMTDTLDLDAEALSPWARAGSPLALQGTEAVSMEITEVSTDSISRYAQARGIAQAAAEAEKRLDPDAEQRDSPLALPIVGLGLVVAALVTRRRP